MLRILIESFEPGQAHGIRGLPVRCRSKICLIGDLEIGNPRCLKVSGRSLIDQGRRNRCAVCAYASQKRNKFSIAILRNLANSPRFVCLLVHNPSPRSLMSNKEALLVPVVDVAWFKVVLGNSRF